MKVYRFWAEPRTTADREKCQQQLNAAAVYRRDLSHIENCARKLSRSIQSLPKEQQVEFNKMISTGQKVANKVARTRARAAGCAWGTCGRVDDAIDQSRRTTKFFDDLSTFASSSEGLLAVQFQRHESDPKWRPVLASSLIGGDNNHVRISSTLVGKSTLRSQRSGNNAGAENLRILSFRVGSEERSPIFVEFYTAMDGYGRGAKTRERGYKPLPDARVIWVCISCHTVGLRQRWELLVTVDEECRGEPDPVRAECVGIDIGWRRVEGGIRTAYWAGSDGDHGELIIPDSVVNRKSKSDSLLSIRDNERNDIAAQWRTWIGTLPLTHPVRIEAVSRAMHAWKKVGRYVGLFRLWGQHRVDGDAQLYLLVQTWLQHDRHLLAWQANNRKRLTNQVGDRVDQLMINLARKYKIVAVEERGMVSKLVRRGASGEKPAVEVARKRIGVVAPGSITSAAEQWSKKYGAIFHEVNPAYTSSTCSKCGLKMEGDLSQLVLHCSQCGECDRDRNAATNIQRRASREMRQKSAESLELRSSTGTTKKLPARRTRRKVVSVSLVEPTT